ncbi:sensor histidine kinase [Nocardioides dongxiaopingii]|uniref:sensor histidine kinase n=1 Tax=Nocardioides sp. S-1144 TaxID=2582905 RepID=UPI0016524958|nr:HAMP domain-containing sensor histidine kinase [Nocardioides sp. S-1144]
MSASESFGRRPSTAPFTAPWWMWQVPTAAFALTVAVLVSLTQRSTPALLVAVAATVLVVVVSVGGLSRRLSDGPLGIVLPLLDMVAAALLHGSAGDATWSTLLVCGLPAAWLAFAFGAAGTALAVAGVAGVAAAPFLAGGSLPSTAGDRLDVVLPALALAGMSVVTYGASRVLSAARAEVVARTEALEMQVRTTAGVLEAVDVAVAVHVPGREPVINELGQRLRQRMESESGPLVFGPDRVTPVPRHEQAHRRAMAGQTFAGLLQWVGEPGDQVAAVCSAHQFGGPSDPGRGWVLAAWDATDLLDSVRVREEFLGTVSHELRTPLTSVMGYLEVLEDTLLDGAHDVATALHHLTVIRRNAVALHERVEQLLNVARAEDDALRLKVVDVASLVRDSLVRHRDAAERAGLRVVASIPPTLQARVDPVALDRIADNLLTNAVKYTADGHIDVSVERPPGSGCHSGFVLRVADTGCGMSETEVRHAFERFYRAEAATKDVVGGLGIGLAVVKQLVDALGGTIAVDSLPGDGTTFVVTVP